MSYWKNKDKLFIGFWKNNKINGFGKIFQENKVRFGLWTDEKDNKKIDWFNSDEEAYNYLENNNLENYKKLFEFSKDEIIRYYSNFYEDNFITPCVLSEELMD